MICMNCGLQQLRASAHYCPQCGRPLYATPLATHNSLDFSHYVNNHALFVGREWILALIDSWLADPTSPRVCLLTGEPGCGKTALAAHLARVAHGSEARSSMLYHLTPGFLSALHFCSAYDVHWN